jgi:hypothetical protein
VLAIRALAQHGGPGVRSTLLTWHVVPELVDACPRAAAHGAAAGGGAAAAARQALAALAQDEAGMALVLVLDPLLALIKPGSGALAAAAAAACIEVAGGLMSCPC